MPYADTAFDAFGPGRLLFGSDWPVCTLAADYATVVGIAETLVHAFDRAEKDAVFRGNAIRVYGLEETGRPAVGDGRPAPG